jgi:inorganic pyrophosphatase
MQVDKIKTGKDVPNDVHVVIENPKDSAIKYEMDKDSGAIFVDRFLFTQMHFPANYGFIPNTLADDGDPLDAFVISRFPVAPGSVIRCRPIGVFKMEDEAGKDEKIVCVPHSKIDKTYKNINVLEDLPEILMAQFKHFLEHYKDLEDGKWVKLSGTGTLDEAKEFINQSVERYKK